MTYKLGKSLILATIVTVIGKEKIEGIYVSDD